MARPAAAALGTGPQRPGAATTYSGGRRPRRPRLRLLLAFLAGLVVVLLILVIGGYFYLDGKLNRSNVLVSYAGQPAAGSGSNWLITGSDSRQGLTRKQERRYHTGIDVSGQRSDTILLLHIPGNGGPAVLVSLPRDSYVKIPGYGWNKLNAAYSFGGPKLLAETVQNATGLRIEHYMGIGFGGLVNVVNSVGGVTMCFSHPLHDTASGAAPEKGLPDPERRKGAELRPDPAQLRQPGPAAGAEPAGVPQGTAEQDDQPGSHVQPVLRRSRGARLRRCR